MQNRQGHAQDVHAFLRRHLGDGQWLFTLPHGHGQETYLARRDDQAFFVKLGAHTPRYRVLGSLGLTPEVLADGHLEDGLSIMVQPYIEGRTPTRRDYRAHLDQFAEAIDRTHHSAEMQRILPQARSDRYDIVGLEALARIRGKWNAYRALAPDVATYVDESLETLAEETQSFRGAGLVASHNDICNANWLVTPDGRLYLVDLDSMSIDDPALDIGATLWWYYPPELRPRFLEIAGYARDQAFQHRMSVRMAMHCLDIALPREGSFDTFSADSFLEWLVDFRAVMAGEENPQGYER